MHEYVNLFWSNFSLNNTLLIFIPVNWLGISLVDKLIKSNTALSTWLLNIFCSNILVVDISWKWINFVSIKVVWKIVVLQLDKVNVWVKLTQIFIIDISADWVDLVSIKVIWQVIVLQLDQTDFVSDLMKILIVNVSGKWINFITWEVVW